jgi:eukaryotic-like serine/threonine-protein kinase
LAYIAMEFLKGKDLADVSKGDALLPIEQVVSICARVADALSYAHTLNVVHRDIKPANIMYEPQSDTVKVTDFGIARITDSSKTKTGLVLGTPSFMSPEQISGKRVDGRSDLYSLGVMLFQMLAGVLPFRGDSMAELMFKIANEEAPDIRIIRREISDSLAAVVALSLSKRADVRYQTGDQMAADLRAAIGLAPGHAGNSGWKTSGFAGASGFGAAAPSAASASASAPAAPTSAVEATQVMSAHDKTVIASAPTPADKTMVMQAGAVAPVSASAAGFEKTAVFDRQNAANSPDAAKVAGSTQPTPQTPTAAPVKPDDPFAKTIITPARRPSDDAGA